METIVLEIGGVSPALFGMGLSHGVTSMETARRASIAPGDVTRLVKRADALAGKDGGHNKFLESVILWISVRAPRYWWQEKDTYRHLSKQSESTMHTLHKWKLTRDDFMEGEIYEQHLQYLNDLITLYREAKEAGDLPAMNNVLLKIKRNLPEGFLQTRQVRLDLKSLRNIHLQRRNHRLPEWHSFLDDLKDQLPERLWNWVTAD